MDPIHDRVQSAWRRCACEVCETKRKARNTEYMRRWRARRRESTPPPDAHGRLSTYINWGCRCDACLEAHRSYHRERRRKLRDAT